MKADGMVKKIVLGKRGLYATTTTLEQLKNVMKAKRRLVDTDMIRKTVTQWKCRLYAVSKGKQQTCST